ncbi:MAG TPA: 50S ribosomal protein L15 [Candidatus Cloacimonadota bacterium]|nr:50S ribosomal protein L15 [Candidatus Cloacimonadota bacterium]
MLSLHTMERPAIKKNRKRLGKGQGTGQGGTAGKGHKGRKARAGGTVPKGFEGGQMPIQRRLPKRGFKNIFKVHYRVLNLAKLQEIEVDALTIQKMEEMGLIPNSGQVSSNPVKVLATVNGEFNKKIYIQANAFSKKAIEMIEQNGGKAEVV